MYSYHVEENWDKITIEGPQFTILNIEGYPVCPWATGAFQMAYKTDVVVPCPAFQLHTTKKFVFKQHKLEEYGVNESNDDTMFSAADLETITTLNRKKTARVYYFQPNFHATVIQSAVCRFGNTNFIQFTEYPISPTVARKRGCDSAGSALMCNRHSHLLFHFIQEIQVAAVAVALCQHYTEECRACIPNYGREIRYLCCDTLGFFSLVYVNIYMCICYGTVLECEQ